MDESVEKIEDWMLECIKLAVDVVVAYVAHNRVAASDLPLLIGDTHAALVRLAGESIKPSPRLDIPTIAQIANSITPEALISFEDGKPYKTLKRHLTSLGLDPETYREKWGLPKDYPMTAPNYSVLRSNLAKSLGQRLPYAYRQS